MVVFWEVTIGILAAHTDSECETEMMPVMYVSVLLLMTAAAYVGATGVWKLTDVVTR